VKPLHVSVALDLGLVAVDTTFHLAGEREQVLVDDLGGLTVPLVLLGPLDVLVHLSLRFEPISTALIRAGERPLFGVGHHVPLQAPGPFERCQAARVGAGEPWPRRVLAANVILQVVRLRKSCSTIHLFADKWPLAKVYSIVVAI